MVNEAVFERAVEEVTQATQRLPHHLTTHYAHAGENTITSQK